METILSFRVLLLRLLVERRTAVSLALITAHHCSKIAVSLSTLSNAPWIMRFFSTAGRNSHYSQSWVSSVPSNPFRYLSSLASGSFSRRSLCSSLGFFLWYGTLPCTLAPCGFPRIYELFPQFREVSGFCLGFPPLHSSLKSLSSSKMGQSSGSFCLFPSFRDHCPLLSCGQYFQRHFFPTYFIWFLLLLFFSYIRWEGKLRPCYSKWKFTTVKNN